MDKPCWGQLSISGQENSSYTWGLRYQGPGDVISEPMSVIAWRIGFFDANTIGCVALEVVLYLSRGVIATRFVMAVVFQWFFSWKSGNFWETPTNSACNIPPKAKTNLAISIAPPRANTVLRFVSTPVQFWSRMFLLDLPFWTYTIE